MENANHSDEPRPGGDTARPAEPDDAVIGKFTGPLKDLHASLVATRNFEIGLFWQRANYFLVLNSGLALGFFSLKETKYAPFFVVIGLVASGLWFWVCLGGKYWQTRWEQRLMDFEASHFAGLALFSAERSRVQADVARGIAFHPTRGLKRLVYRVMIACEPSVSFSMTLLSLLFVLAWAALGVLLSRGV